MAIASPSPPTFTPSSFCCTTCSESSSSTRHQLVRFPSSSTRFATRRLLTTNTTTCRVNSSNKPFDVSPDNGSNGDVVLHPEGVASSKQFHRHGSPVFVTLPVDTVGPADAGRVKRRKIIATSLWTLATAGVEGVVMEVWWGVVEREQPRVYNWNGYLDIVSLARQCGLKVRAVLAFHRCGSGPDDPNWIPLPQWVLEEIDNDPDLAYSDRFSRRNSEYISLGCDILPVLWGRSPIQVYSDFMRNFRDTFRPFLGVVITGIQVGMGPATELRYPSYPSKKLTWAWRSHELGQFQCYDKYMLASLNGCAQETGMREWGNWGPTGAGSLMHDPEFTEFFKSEGGSWKTPYGKFFLEWYSGMLLLHGERICREAATIFRGTEANMSAKVAGIHWHYGTQSQPSELTAGYYNTSTRDGYLPIARMFGRYGFALCCSGFEMQDVEQKQMHPDSSPEGFLRQLLLAARVCDIPLDGENSAAILDDESYKQVLKLSRFYSDGLERPSFSFNFVRMNKTMFEHYNWVRFTRFVRQMADANIFRAKLDFRGHMSLSSDPTKAGMAYAYF